MKTLKMMPFLLGTILLFTFCTKDEIEIRRPGMDNPVVGQKQILDNNDNNDCIIVQTLWAGAGQNDTTKGTNVGYVTAEIDYPYLIVTYQTVGWTLTEVHLWVGTDIYDIPRQAAPGRFPYKANLNNVTEHQFTIHLEDIGIGENELVYVAAHSVVQGMEYEYLDEVLPETAEVFVKYYNHDPKFTGSYFRVDLSNAGFLNGLNHKGWCLDLEVPMQFDYPFNPYTAYVHNSYGVLPADLVNNPENLPGINYLFNQNLSAYNLQTIQVAIWVLMEGYDMDHFDENHQALGVTGFVWADVMVLVNMALYNLDFVPECGQYIGIILVKDGQQTVIIKVPVPCKGGKETAWAFGEHTFIEHGIANKWGWIFEVDLSECP